MVRSDEDIVIDNLKGFIRKGARARSTGNIPFGHFELDFALCYGFIPTDIDLNSVAYDPSKPLGLPLGRLVEIFGNEGSGKSSLAHRIVGSAQKMGYKAAWIDLEHSYQEDLAEINGVNVDDVLFSEGFSITEDKNYYAEDVMDGIVELCKSGAVKVIVLDSVAHLLPKYRDEHDAGKVTVALLARLLSEQIGKVSHYAAKHDVLIIFINQIRDKPGIMFGPSETTPGGHALKFSASVRIRVSLRTAAEHVIFVGDELVGRNSGVSITKNRMARPLLDKNGSSITLSVPIYYKKYFPNISEILFETGRQLKLISVREKLYSWEEHKKLEHDSFIKMLEDDKKLFNTLLSSVKEKAKELSVVLPTEIAIQEFLDDDDVVVEEQVESDNTENNKPHGRKPGRKPGKKKLDQ